MTRSADQGEPRIRRILVAADPSSHGLAALDAAVRLAAALGAELTVLYVENADLLNVPRLSIIREMDALSGELREWETEGLEQRLRLEAARVRRKLERAVLRHDLKWSFRVTRGRIVTELLEAAAHADLVSLGTRSHWVGRGPGSTVRAVLTRSGKPVMVLQRGARLGDRVCVFFDGSVQARAGLRMAEHIVQGRDAQLCVLLGSPFENAEALWREATESLGPDHGEADPVPLKTLDPREVAGHLKRGRCGLLVVPRDRFTLANGILASLLEAAPCPVLLVGGGS